MNKTKKLTTGAMLLAIVGALMIIDRQLSYMFEIVIIMIMPVVIIIYSTLYELREGIILSICFLILSIILGDPTYAFINVPIAVVVGVGYSLGIKKNFSRKKLLIISILLFFIGEFVSLFIISPLLGINIIERLSSLETSFTDYINRLINKNPNSLISLFIDEINNSYKMLGISLRDILILSLALEPIILGLGEGFIIHTVSQILLKKFRIKEFEKGSIISFNLNPIVAYICFALFACNYFIGYIENETIKIIIMGLSFMSELILAYYGYLFTVLFLKTKTEKNSSRFFLFLLIILFLPLMLFSFVILGFLYGTGPLKKYLQRGIEQQ